MPMGCELEIVAVTSDTALWAELCVGVTAVSRLVALLYMPPGPVRTGPL